MKRLLAIFFLSVLFLPLSGNCKKDPSTFPEEYVQYLLLCPTGKSQCYNDCATSTGYPGGGETAGQTYIDFTGCTGNCDARCNETALFLSLLDD